MNFFKSITKSTLFSPDVVDFNFDLDPFQILSELEDYELLNTQMFCKEYDDIFRDKKQDNLSEIIVRDIALELKSKLPYDDINSYAYSKSNAKDTIDKNQIVSYTNSKSLENIDSKLDEILSTKKNKNNDLANRRDVINKAILRGFKKYFVNLLNNIKPKSLDSSKRIKYLNKSSLMEQAKAIRLIEMSPNQESKLEFEELVCWMGFPKNTKKVRCMFSFENSAISLMEDVISYYSHQKLSLALKNESIKVLFSYFIRYGKEQMMNKIKSIYNGSNMKNQIYESNNGSLESYEEAFQNLINQIEKTKS